MNAKALIPGVIIALTGLFLLNGCQSSGPYQTTGIKIGEVTDTTAIVWTRLTRNPRRIGSEAPMPQVTYRDVRTSLPVAKTNISRKYRSPVVTYPDGTSIDTIEGAVPGTPGEMRILYKPKSDLMWNSTDWQAVEPKRDFAKQTQLINLKPNTAYQVRVEARAEGKKGQAVVGGFLTAPRSAQAERVVFTVSTGQAYGDQDAAGGGYNIYPEMLKLNPSFFVHTGDILYYDKLAKDIDLARWHWQRMYSLPTNVEFHKQVGSYFIKDDHDTLCNDCWPGMEPSYMGDFTFEQGLKVFVEQVPMGEQTWRTYRWGRDLQIWLVEGRDFRSPNTMLDGPKKTIWGAEQKAWFKRTVQESEATFRILISPTPVVGPDRENKRDNHSNANFAYEGNELREFIGKQKNMYVLCGDRHWQYVSVDPKTGVREYSCGPASNEHAGGWSNDKRMAMHQYLNVIGGFLAVTVDRAKGKPEITFRHYDVDGKVMYEEGFMAQ